MNDGFAFLVLKFLREKGERGANLAELLSEICPLNWTPRGKIPEHTGAGIIGGALGKLIQIGLVELSSSVDYKELRNYDAAFMSVGDLDYETAELLRNIGEKRVFLKISKNYSVLQQLFGFSLSGKIRNLSEPVMEVRPFFGINRNLAEKFSVFVLMPFVPELDEVYRDHIAVACVQASHSVGRADDLYSSRKIVEDIWAAICSAEWIIADCTGRNPNVFYEIGMAHTVGKKVVLITQNADDVPFDLRHIRYFKYDFTPRGMKKLEEVLVRILSGEKAEL